MHALIYEVRKKQITVTVVQKNPIPYDINFPTICVKTLWGFRVGRSNTYNICESEKRFLAILLFCKKTC